MESSTTIETDRAEQIRSTDEPQLTRIDWLSEDNKIAMKARGWSNDNLTTATEKRDQHCGIRPLPACNEPTTPPRRPDDGGIPNLEF